jgi:acyl carrier protein
VIRFGSQVDPAAAFVYLGSVSHWEAIRRRAELHPDRPALVGGPSYGALAAGGWIAGAGGDRDAMLERLGELLAGCSSERAASLWALDGGITGAFRPASGAIVALPLPDAEDPFGLALVLSCLAAGATLCPLHAGRAFEAIAAARATLAVLPFSALATEPLGEVELRHLARLALRIQGPSGAALLSAFLEGAERRGLRRAAITPFFADPSAGVLAVTPRGAGPSLATVGGASVITAGPLVPGVDRSWLSGELALQEGELVVLGAIEAAIPPAEPSPQVEVRPPAPGVPRRAEGEIEAWIVRWIAAETASDEASIDPDASFRDLGLTSAKEVLMSAELERWLGRVLSPTLTWDYPSAGRLAGHLAGEER